MDRRADIFSLGLVFYEMVTDQKPFLATSEANVLELVRECRIAPPTALNPRIPPRLEGVIMKALDRDPENRYQEASEMLKDLDRILHERQPPTNAELARFMEILFDEDERGAPRPVGDDVVEGAATAGLEIELDAAHGGERSGESTPARHSKEEDASVNKLMKRLGLK
jgi:serine/threonine-protein kinase